MTSLSKSTFLKIMDDKCQLILSFSFSEAINQNLSDVSEFHHLVRDYFNLLGNFCMMPLARGMKLEHKIKLKTPAWYWTKCFIESTKLELGKRYRPMKKFIFIKDGKYEITVSGQESLRGAVIEAKRRIKELNTIVFHLLTLVKTEDIHEDIGVKLSPMDEDKIFVDMEKGQLIYKGKVLKTLMQSKFPFRLLKASFENKGSIPINALNAYTADDIETGIRNFNADLKKQLGKVKVSERVQKSFLVKKPSNKIIVDDIFVRA